MCIFVVLNFFLGSLLKHDDMTLLAHPHPRVSFLPISAAAQGTPAGTIYGYILYSDHRPVPGARVVVESPNTGATRDVVSNQQGVYSVPALPAALTTSRSMPTDSRPFTSGASCSKPTNRRAWISG